MNPDVIHSFPLEVTFCGERAVDTGGVGREFFSAFWEEAYRQAFDGASLLTSSVHTHIDLSSYTTLGKLLLHGYLSCGFLPVRITFPTLAAILLGPSVDVSSSILSRSFLDFLSSVDRQTISNALCLQMYSHELESKLVTIRARLGCRKIPAPHNLRDILLKLAGHEFVSRPYAAVDLMHNGIPPAHQVFWSQKSVEELFGLYVALIANPRKVLGLLDEPLEFKNPSEERVYGYLQQLVHWKHGHSPGSEVFALRHRKLRPPVYQDRCDFQWSIRISMPSFGTHLLM